MATHHVSSPFNAYTGTGAVGAATPLGIAGVQARLQPDCGPPGAQLQVQVPVLVVALPLAVVGSQPEADGVSPGVSQVAEPQAAAQALPQPEAVSSGCVRVGDACPKLETVTAPASQAASAGAVTMMALPSAEAPTLSSGCVSVDDHGHRHGDDDMDLEDFVSADFNMDNLHDACPQPAAPCEGVLEHGAAHYVSIAEQATPVITDLEPQVDNLQVKLGVQEVDAGLIVSPVQVASESQAALRATSLPRLSQPEPPAATEAIAALAVGTPTVPQAVAPPPLPLAGTGVRTDSALQVPVSAGCSFMMTATAVRAIGSARGRVDDDSESLSSDSDDSEDHEVPQRARKKCPVCNLWHTPQAVDKQGQACPVLSHLPAAVVYECLSSGDRPDSMSWELPDQIDIKKCDSCRHWHVPARRRSRVGVCPLVQFARQFNDSVGKLVKHLRNSGIRRWNPIAWAPPSSAQHQAMFDFNSKHATEQGLHRHVLALAGSPTMQVPTMSIVEPDFTWLVLEALVSSRGLAAAVADVNDFCNWRLYSATHGTQGPHGPMQGAGFRLDSAERAVISLARSLWRAVADVWGVVDRTVHDFAGALACSASDSETVQKVTEGAFHSTLVPIVAACGAGEEEDEVRRAASQAAFLLYFVSSTRRAGVPSSTIDMVNFPNLTPRLSGAIGCFYECWWVLLTPYRCSNSHDRKCFPRNVYEAECVVAVLDVRVPADELHRIDKAILVRGLKDQVLSGENATMKCPWCRHKSATIDISSVQAIGIPPTIIIQIVGTRSCFAAMPEKLQYDRMSYRVASFLFAHGKASAAGRYVASTSRYLVILRGGGPSQPSYSEVGSLHAAMAIVETQGVAASPKIVVYEATHEARLCGTSMRPTSVDCPPEVFGGCGNRQLVLALFPRLHRPDANVVPWQRHWRHTEKVALNWVCEFIRCSRRLVGCQQCV